MTQRCRQVELQVQSLLQGVCMSECHVGAALLPAASHYQANIEFKKIIFFKRSNIFLPLQTICFIIAELVHCNPLIKNPTEFDRTRPQISIFLPPLIASRLVRLPGNSLKCHPNTPTGAVTLLGRGFFFFFFLYFGNNEKPNWGKVRVVESYLNSLLVLFEMASGLFPSFISD